MTTSPDGKSLPFWYAAKKTGSTRRLERARANAAEGASQEDQGKILAPVPGKVITVLVGGGSQVSSGDIILVLESMKMEFEVKAARDGIVEALDVKPGDQVTAGQVLASFA
jgi:propionyl-CoA carboxylase alpha chain